MHRVATALFVLLTASCFDFTAAEFGGEGATCGDSDHYCRPGFRCDETKRCTRDCRNCGSLLAGDACASNDDCSSSSCVAGVCCAERCESLCTSCDGELGRGVCQSATRGTLGFSECNGNGCNGAGGCLLSDGTPCNSSTECNSGSCVDGVCCNAACAGLCESCSTALTGSVDGLCAATRSGFESGGECVGPVTCDGTRSCFNALLGATCSKDYECLSGHCVEGTCCEDACNGICQTCNVVGQCVATVNAEDPSTCDDSTGCSNPPCTCGPSGACGAAAGGCTTPGECASGACSDGVCCNTPCTGTCESCRASDTGKPTGTCEPIPSGADPANECSATQYYNMQCGGDRMCRRQALGEICMSDSHCASSHCVIYNHADGIGICCTSTCTEICNSCDGLNTTGQCVFTSHNPNNPCPNGQACDAPGHCRP